MLPWLHPAAPPAVRAAHGCGTGSHCWGQQPAATAAAAATTTAQTGAVKESLHQMIKSVVRSCEGTWKDAWLHLLRMEGACICACVKIGKVLFASASLDLNLYAGCLPCNCQTSFQPLHIGGRAAAWKTSLAAEHVSCGSSWTDVILQEPCEAHPAVRRTSQSSAPHTNIH